MPTASRTRMATPKTFTFVDWHGDPPEPGDYLYGPMNGKRTEPSYKLIVDVRPGRVNPWIVRAVAVEPGDVAADARIFQHSWIYNPRKRAG